MVIDAYHYLSLTATHEVSHKLVVLEGKVHAIACRLPVRRIHVVKGVSTAVTLAAVQPGQVFNVGAGQPLPSCREVLLDPQQVDSRTGGRGTKRLPRHLAGKGMVLQVEESSGALDVGEGFRAGHLLPLEHLARTKRPFELAHEFFQVALHNAVQSELDAASLNAPLSISVERPLSSQFPSKMQSGGPMLCFPIFVGAVHMSEEYSLPDLLERMYENQLALEAAVMELTLQNEKQGLSEMGDNVRGALFVIDENAGHISKAWRSYEPNISNNHTPIV